MKNTTVKIISFILAVLTAASLVSCSSEKKGGNLTEGIDPSASGNPIMNNSQTDNTTDTSVDTAAAPVASDYKVGVCENHQYTSEQLGIGCKFDNGWNLYTEDEIDTLTRQIMGKSRTQILQNMQENSRFYDMVADTTDNKSLNIFITKVSEEKTSSELAETLESEKEQTLVAYTESGMTDVTYEISEMNFLGRDVVCTTSSGTSNGVKGYIKQVIFYDGLYSVVITAVSYKTDDCDSILGMLYELN